MKTKLLLSVLLLTLVASVVFAQPTITSFSPVAGPPGTLVTINGTNLGSPTGFTIGIGGWEPIVVSDNGSQLVGYVMPHAATGPITITTAGGYVSSTTNFTVTATSYPLVQKGNPLINIIPYNPTNGTDIEQGSAVALSADGSTAIVGASYFNVGSTQNVGVAWVYVWNGTAWVQQAALQGTTAGYARQGYSVALSADGNTAMIGGIGYNMPNTTGAVWFFTRTGSTWTQQGGACVGTGAIGYAEQGSSCALSADGNTAIEGGLNDNSTGYPSVPGAAWVFTRSGGVWTQQGSKLTASDNAGDAEFGTAVGISADAGTVIIGGPGDSGGKGATWIFTQPGGTGTTWPQMGNKIIGAGGTTQDAQGASVAISADGLTAMIGAPGSNQVWAFGRVVIVWEQIGSAFTGTGITGEINNGEYSYGTFGESVSLSADGNTALIGGGENGNFDSPVPGGTWMFTRNGINYVQQLGPVLGTGPGTTADGAQGTAVALSANGTTAITGGPTNGIADDNGYRYFLGGVWAFMADANANLSNLQISNSPLTLQPNFSSSTISYTASVGNGIASTTITPTAADPGATIMVNNMPVTSGSLSQSLPLVVGPNTITITVIAPDGATVKTYTLIVTRAASANANLSSLKRSSGTLIPTFSAGTTTYTENVDNATATMSVTPTAADANAAIKVNGTTVVSGTVSPVYNLTAGTGTVITTIVTAQNGTTKTYTLTVNRPLSDNDNLSDLQLSTGVLAPAFQPHTQLDSYSAKVGSSTTTIQVTPTAADASATITVNTISVPSGTARSISLSPGANPITVVVTAQNGATRTYTLTITRKNNDASLANLQVSVGALAPPFEPHTQLSAYSVSEASGISSVDVTPTTTDPDATVTINTNTATSGQPTTMPVSAGANPVTIVVTASDGSTKRTYNLTVNVTSGDDDVYQPVSVEKPADSPTLNNDGITVHQAVSPNGDGINDFLQIDNITNYPDNRLSILNRNGQLIYEANGYDNSSKVFDGHSNKNGQMQLPGTYFYQLDYTVNGITKHKNGFLVLKY